MTFYCCDELLEELADSGNEEPWTVREAQDVFHFKYCPFCGFKLSMLR